MVEHIKTSKQEEIRGPDMQHTKILRHQNELLAFLNFKYLFMTHFLPPKIRTDFY